MHLHSFSMTDLQQLPAMIQPIPSRSTGVSNLRPNVVPMPQTHMHPGPLASIHSSATAIAQPTIRMQSHLPSHSMAFMTDPTSSYPHLQVSSVSQYPDYRLPSTSPSTIAQPTHIQASSASLLQYQGYPGPEGGLPSVSAPFITVAQPTIEMQPAPYQHILPFSPSANWPQNAFVPPNSLPTSFLPHPLPAPPASFAPPLTDFCTKLCNDPLALTSVPTPSNIAASNSNNSEPILYEFVWALDDQEDASLPRNSFRGTNVIPVGMHNLDLVQTDQFTNKRDIRQYLVVGYAPIRSAGRQMIQR